MSQLFDLLPNSLFNPLAAQGGAVYANILLSFYDETLRHHYALSRESALHCVVTHLTAPDALEQTQDAVDNVVDDEGDEIRTRASAILRYLARAGWLRSETQNDFSQIFIFPDYAFRILRALSEIANNQTQSLQGAICAIHDVLQAAVRDGDVHERLPQAYRDTLDLINGLKELQHNIGIHIERVLRQMQAKDVLTQVFATYRSEIVDRVYHHLQTTDHVSRYRPGIIEATMQLERTGAIEIAAQRLRERGEYVSVELAAQQLTEQTRMIREQFQDLDRLLEAIQTRHSQFVDSAVRTVELQLASHSTMSGQLNAILMRLLGDKTFANAEKFFGITDDLTNLFKLQWLDTESLAPPTSAPTPFVVEPTASSMVSDEELQRAREETLRQMNRAVSRERVKRLVRDLLADRDEITSDEIPLTGPDDVSLLIYLHEYGRDSALGYEFAPTEEWCECNGIGFRKFVLRKAK